MILMGKMPMLRDCRCAVAKQSESATERPLHPALRLQTKILCKAGVGGV